MSTSSNQEVVHEGWLTKSPPSKRIWRARWRRRWFALRQSGELPGQYVLEYYTDRNCRKLKGRIDLDQCEQVDSGLTYEQRKLKYQFMFDIKTPSRIYYLAAETEQDMNSWVECICQVCSLKVYNNDYPQQLPTNLLPEVEAIEITEESNNAYESFSGPYIPISQCITGKPLTSPTGAQTLPRYNNSNNEDNFGQTSTMPFTPVKQNVRKNSHTGSCNASLDCKFYDSPRKHGMLNESQSLDYTNVNIPSDSSPTLQSPTDSESVFTDEEWLHSMPKLPLKPRQSRPSDASSIEFDSNVLSAAQKFTKINLVETKSVPPRPPKPLHLLGNGPSHNYLNLENSNSKPSIAERRAIKNQEKQLAKEDSDASGVEAAALSPNAVVSPNDMNLVIADDMYDFPRTHHTSELDNNNKENQNQRPQKHCYNNAAPVVVPTSGGSDTHVFRYDISPSAVSSTDTTAGGPESQIFQYDFNTGDEATDEPASPCSQSSCSTTAMYSNVPSPLLAPNQNAVTPPAVNRGLKPRGLSNSTSIHSLNDTAPSVNRKLKPVLPVRNAQSSLDNHSQDGGEYGNIRRIEMRNSNSRTSNCHNEFENISVSQSNAADSLTNFDILQYLDLDLDVDTRSCSLNSLQQQPPRSNNNSKKTVYKTVDFVKTEAFNRTKKTLEAERKQHPSDL